MLQIFEGQTPLKGEITASNPLLQRLSRVRESLRNAKAMKDAAPFEESLNDICRRLEQLTRQVYNDEANHSTDGDRDSLRWDDMRQMLDVRCKGSAILLDYLVRNPDVVMSRDQLAAKLGYSAKTITVYMTHLRFDLDARKLGRVIDTIHSAGYVITAENAKRLTALVWPHQAGSDSAAG